MNSTLKKFIDELIVREGNGKYTNDPKDSGGPTRWGITQAVARAYGYTGDMQHLPREIAVDIYVTKYWTKPGFGNVATVSEPIAERLFDFGVLAGQVTSAKQLQRLLNVLNQNGRAYPDIVADGVIGTRSIEALKSFKSRRGAEGMTVLLGGVASMQSVYLIELAEKRPKDEEYAYGWLLNRSIGAVLL